MKLIWHIIKRDIVRDCWALLLWALLYVGQVGIGLVMLCRGGVGLQWMTEVQLASAALVFLQAVMGYILVARLVQADPLIGTSMFWLTRPISAAKLFGAKALGALLLFGFLPVLLLLPWWLYCDFGWREILWTVVDTMGWQLLMIAPAFLVASLTDDLGRVLLWTLLLVIGLFSWIIILQASGRVLLANPEAKVGASVVFSKLWVSAVILVAGGFGIAMHQFLTRRFVRSVLLVTGCLGLIALIGDVWPWNWAQRIGELHRPARAPAPDGLVEGLTISAAPGVGLFSRKFAIKREASEKEAGLHLSLRVQGLPSDMMIATEGGEQTWFWADGLKLTRGGSFRSVGAHAVREVLRRQYSLPVPAEDPESVQWWKARREKLRAGLIAKGTRPDWQYQLPTNRPGVLNGEVSLPNSVLAKMQHESPAYEADLHWGVQSPEVVMELPLKAGARDSGQSRTVQLLQLDEADKPLLLTTRSSVAGNGLWNSAAINSGSRGWLRQESMQAVNHHTGDIDWVGDNQKGSQYLRIGGVIVNWNFLLVRPRTVNRDGQWVISDPQWAEHISLVFLGAKEIARFVRVVKENEYTVKIISPDTGATAAGSTEPDNKS